jgi:hypothetical protein
MCFIPCPRRRPHHADRGGYPVPMTDHTIGLVVDGGSPPGSQTP